MQNGMTLFFGPIFIHPVETEHEPTKMFYKREVFLSHLEETLPMTCVIGISLIDSINLSLHITQTAFMMQCILHVVRLV